MDQYYKLADQPINSQIQSILPANVQIQNQLPPNGLPNSGVQTPAAMSFYYQHPLLLNRNFNNLGKRAVRIGDQCIPECPRALAKDESSCCIS